MEKGSLSELAKVHHRALSLLHFISLDFSASHTAQKYDQRFSIFRRSRIFHQLLQDRVQGRVLVGRPHEYGALTTQGLTQRPDEVVVRTVPGIRAEELGLM